MVLQVLAIRSLCEWLTVVLQGVMDMTSMALGLASMASSVINPVGRSFVLGLPDRLGNYCVGIAGMVWKIPSGAYQPGDRVRVLNAEEDLLEVERVIN